MNNFLKISLLILFALFAIQGFAQNTEYGLAKRYDDQLQGTRTASGQAYDAQQFTAAHRTYPFGTNVKVTRQDNGKSVVVSINDRGPYIKGQAIDLSGNAAAKLGIESGDMPQVRLEVVKNKPNNQALTRTKPAPKPSQPARMQTTSSSKKATPPAPKTNNKVSTIKSGSKGYGVQVGAFKSQANAQAFIKQLEGKWYSNIGMHTATINGQKHYKVILGNYTSKAQAETYLNNLKQKNMDGFLINFANLKG